ncbi:hypothetical protein [Gelidibacter pelagius]|uniref:Uncharacterized protein n=1 Tax=Gelidibacter pelagius TaxID=2819985 RepID=A0ABS3ST20_9FLAO|nr:hypothetical protein [Gelidibacter pelagius]MBO3098863.1 hypothetical protein [Gelidibacter pelagius]
MVFRKLLILLLFTYIPLLFAQENKVYFDDALSQHLRKFNIKSDLAIKNQMPDKVDALFDTLIRVHIRNTYISNLKLKKVAGGTLHTENIDKPFLLITKNSAIIQTKEEIKAINSLANEYNGKVDIIILYWNKKDIAKKKARHYNKNITVVYVDERHNNFNHALSALKHSFGAPACFYINQFKQISDIDRKFFLKNVNKSTKELFTEKAHKGITELLANQNDTALLNVPKVYR